MLWTRPEDGPRVVLGPDLLQPFEHAIRREWLLTNGIGGFAGGTVVGASTRRYHGLLVAATRPPVGRIATVAKLEETVRAPLPSPRARRDDEAGLEAPEEFQISCNQYADTVHPEGNLWLESFTWGRRPRWRWRLRDLWLEKTLFLVHGANTAVVVYSHLDGPEAELAARPLVVHRDYHAVSRENSALNPNAEVLPGCLTLRPYLGLPPIRMATSRGRFVPWPVWYKALEYPVENERGLDFHEDAFSPGSFVARLAAGDACAIVLSTEDRFPAGDPPDPAVAAALAALAAGAGEHGADAPALDPLAERFQHALEAWCERAWLDEDARLRRLESAPGRSRERARAVPAARARDFGLPAAAPAVAGGATAVERAAPPAPGPPAAGPSPTVLELEGEPLPEDGLHLLARAADQFWVRRGSSGHSVIAGYPWFTDWGRDTMIALPGLMLATGRFDLGREVLATFCQHLDRGMIPNRFPDGGFEPEYNTVDATLWMFWAADHYLRSSGDEDFLRGTLYPAFREVIAHHQRGTRFGIRLDEDGLLTQGEKGVQLTWMDAKADDWVVTPRHGKPVEVNGLWHFALVAQAHFARRLGHDADASYYRALAERAREAFHRTFWAEALGYFHDTVDENGPDPSLRPNQVLALALPAGLVPAERARRALAVVERHLVTPFGLRSLAPADPRYQGVYLGDRLARDGAYHQGTVWSWLVGPYVTAYLNAHGRDARTRAHARRLVEPLLRHLGDACLGSVSEIFDGDLPHAPRGCVAQAWSVAELARVWLEEGL